MTINNFLVVIFIMTLILKMLATLTNNNICQLLHLRIKLQSVYMPFVCFSPLHSLQCTITVNYTIKLKYAYKLIIIIVNL